jgi:transcriptional regulator with XRE-family HTH domain
MWGQFFQDLESAQHRVIIQSAFIGSKRMSSFWKPFEKLRKRNIPICIFLQQPDTWKSPDSPPVTAFSSLVGGLQNLGVHVTLKPLVHEKLMVIDLLAVWDGTLNYLSHTVTSERIHRFANAEVIREAIETHGLNTCAECNSNRDIGLANGSPSSILKSLRHYRQQVGMSQQTFAAVCDVTQSWISKIESTQKPSISIGTICHVASKADATPVVVPNVLMPLLAEQLAKLEASKRQHPHPSAEKLQTGC